MMVWKPRATRSSWLVLLAILVSSLSATGSAQSAAPFAPLETAVPDGIGPALGLGDVNGDGSKDLIVMGPPYVLLNDGHGTFTAVAGSSGFVSGFPVTVPQSIIADFNQDGRADLLVNTGTSVMSQWIGTAAGTLASAGSTAAVTGNIRSIAAGDVNGDGTLDVVCGTTIPNPGGMPQTFAAATAVFLNNGSALIPSGALGLPNVGTSGMILLDADVDGDQDLAVQHGTGLAIMVNGGGTFTGPPGFFGATGFGGSLFAARLNGDAYPDVIVRGFQNVPSMMVGGPAGFAPSPTTLTAPVAQFLDNPLAAFDLTGDGIDEVLVADYYGFGAYSVGAPGPAPLLFRVDRAGGPLISGDLDGDADVDLLVRAEGVWRVSFSDGAGNLRDQGAGYDMRVLLGGPVPFDLNGDGAPELLGTAAGPTGAVVLAIAHNDGHGRFAWTDVPIAGQPLALARSLLVLADVSGDGLKDLAVIEMSAVGFSTTTWSFALRVVLQGPAGTWTAGAASPTLAQGYRCDAVAGDWNGDGFDDLVFSDHTTGVRILYSSGATLVTPGATVTTSPASRLLAFDADGDSDRDLVVAGEPSLLLINSGGSFNSDPSFAGVWGARFATAADLDGNGQPDVWLNNTAFLHLGASWISIGSVAGGTGGSEVCSFDFDFDGDLDSVAGNGVAFVFEAPGVIGQHLFPVPPISGGLRISPVDLDRDGDADLVMTPAIDQPQYMGLVTRPGSVLSNTARQLSQDSPARPGRPLGVSLRGAPGGNWLLYAAPAPGFMPLPPYGTVFIDPVTAFPLGSGTLGPGGSAVVSIPMPAWASIYVGSLFEFQGLVDTVGGARLTNARHVPIVTF
jgi:hypothetical protein